MIADGLVVDGQRLGYLAVGETFEVGHFKDLAAAAGELFNFFIDGFQHQRFYIVRQLTVVGLLEESMEEILLPELAPLDMTEEIQACIAACDIKKCFYVPDTIEVGAQAPQLDKDVGRDVLGVFALGDKPFDEIIYLGKILIINSRERLGVSLVELNNKIVVGALHQIDFL